MTQLNLNRPLRRRLHSVKRYNFDPPHHGNVDHLFWIGKMGEARLQGSVT